MQEIDERFNAAISDVCSLTPSASSLLRACVIQRLRWLIPECRTHQIHGKRQIMRADDVILAQGKRRGRGLSNVGSYRPRDGRDAKSRAKPTAAASSTGLVAPVEDVVRYVLEPTYTGYNPSLRPPQQKTRILDILAKLVREPDALEEHLHRALTVFAQLFPSHNATVADLFNVPLPILLGKRPLPSSLRQRCARIVNMTSDVASQSALANAMGVALDQVSGASPSYEVARGALWGFAHHPRRQVEFHEKIAVTLFRCWSHFQKLVDNNAAREVMDVTWTILRKEYEASVAVSVKRPLGVNLLGDEAPARRRKAARLQAIPKLGAAVEREASVENPVVPSPYIRGPLSVVAHDTYPAEMLSRSDPFLRLTI